MSHGFLISFFPSISNWLMTNYPTITSNYIFMNWNNTNIDDTNSNDRSDNDPSLLYTKHYIPIPIKHYTGLGLPKSVLFLIIQYPMLLLNALVGIYIGLYYSYVMYQKYLESTGILRCNNSNTALVSTSRKTIGTQKVNVSSSLECSSQATANDYYYYYTEQMNLLWSFAFLSFGCMNIVSIPYHCIRFVLQDQSTTTSIEDTYENYAKSFLSNEYNTNHHQFLLYYEATHATTTTQPPLEREAEGIAFMIMKMMQKTLWGLDCYFTGMSSMALIMASICMMQLLFLSSSLIFGHQQQQQLRIQHPLSNPLLSWVESVWTLATTTSTSAAISYVDHWYSIGIVVFVGGFYQLFFGTFSIDNAIAATPSTTILLECWYLVPTYLSIMFLLPTIVGLHYKEQQMMTSQSSSAIKTTNIMGTKASSSIFLRWSLLLIGPLLFVCALHIDWYACSYFTSDHVTKTIANPITNNASFLLPWDTIQIFVQDFFMVGTIGFFASNVSFFAIALFLQHYYDCHLSDFLLQDIGKSYTKTIVNNVNYELQKDGDLSRTRQMIRATNFS